MILIIIIKCLIKVIGSHLKKTLSLNRSSTQGNLLVSSAKLQVSAYFHGNNDIICLKETWKWHFWLSCLYRMRTTFLLPLARMLEAFYRAIKAVNQSLLNDPWFLTCFTGSDTVVAAHCTHGFALRGLPTQSTAVWAMNTLCDNVIALLVAWV